MTGFDTHLFFADGKAPESAHLDRTELSERWLSVCGDLLTHYGPVFSHNMGSTLSHFDIHLGGPHGELKAYDQLTWRFAFSTGTSSDQDRASLDHFTSVNESFVSLAGHSLSDAARTIIRSCESTPSFLVFDCLPPEVPDDQKWALLQLGYHLFAAYLDYVSE